MKKYIQIVPAKKVLSLAAAMVMLALTFTVILSYADADAIDGDHMQDANGSNVSVSNQVIRKGWGFARGNGLYALADPTVNFGITFDDPPFLVVTFASSREVSAGNPTVLSDCTTARKVIAAGINQTKTGFQPIMRTTDDHKFVNTTNYCYTWIAIGKHTASYNGETDPQVGSNVTNLIPRWNGSALVSGSLYNYAGKVGLGTTNPGYTLDINSYGNSFKVGSANTWIRTWTSGSPSMSFSDGGGYRAGYIYGGQNSTSENVFKLTACDDAGNCPSSFYAHESGNFGVGNSDPSHKLTITNKVTDDALRLTGPQGGSLGYGARLNFGDKNYTYLDEDEDDKLYIYSRLRTSIMGGYVGINTTAPDHRLHVNGTAKFVVGGGSIAMTTPGGWPGMVAYSPNGHRRDVQYYDTFTAITISNSSSAPSSSNGIQIHESGNVGIGVTNPSAKLHVNGRTKTKEVEITGGSDIAEPFNITGGNNLDPGSVVVIDEKNTGHLKLSDRAYDKRVAGIISGAGGINPGLTLKQEGLMDGEQNVAISGRVYVKANTSNGEINPGDLLTTSENPGYAMKVTKHQRAQGAIIGKAMSTLSSGEGLVLVLVTLQ